MTSRKASLLVVVIDALLLWPFAYRNGFGHGDLDAMQMALYAPSGSPVRQWGRSFSFGWYWLAGAIRHGLSISLSDFPTVINIVAVLASTAGDVCLMLALALIAPLDVALAATILWRFTPEVWELGTYGHPWTLALPLFFGAVVLVASGVRRQSHVRHVVATLLFFAAFAIRADIALLLLPALVVAYRHRRDMFGSLLRTSCAGVLIFILTQWMVAGDELIHATSMYAGGPIDPRAWFVNLAVFGYGFGLAYLGALAIGGWRGLQQGTTHREMGWLAIALAPTVVLWVSGGGSARHFGPVYVVLGTLLAWLVVNRWQRQVVRAIVIAGLIVSNAVIAEIVFTGFARAQFQSIQLGEARRVIERVPLGNVWSNHRATVRMNDLDNAYVTWALHCSTERPAVFAQETPHRLVMLASDRYGSPSMENEAYTFGSSPARLWIVAVPPNGSLSWWTHIQGLAAARESQAVLLGPRIPRSLADAWQGQVSQSPYSAAEETVERIAARPCPAPRAF